MRDGVIVIDLNLDATLRSELWHDDSINHLLKEVGVGLAAESVVIGMKVGCRDDVGEVRRLKPRGCQLSLHEGNEMKRYERYSRY